MPRQQQVLIVGAGPTGLAAALALAACGVPVALVGPPAGSPPGRTAALLGASMALLDAIGAGAAVRAAGAPLTAIRLVDDTGNVLRAPEVVFRARDLGLDAFGWNIANAALIDALTAAARGAAIERVASAVARLECSGAGWTAHLAEGGSLWAPLIIGADGRNSPTRVAAGITLEAWSYPQTALVGLIRHGRPHQGVSTELHRRAGPLTVVPMAGNAASLVWVETSAEAERLAGLDDPAFTLMLEQHLQGLLGSIESVSERALFALSGGTARRMVGDRVALVGEAGHVFPPIGAQGLNLGMRDVAVLAEVVGDAVAAGCDPGAAAVLADYAARRAADVATRTLGVDLLNRSLLAGLLPVDLARGAALHLVHAVPALRRVLMRQGLEGGGALPRLMRPQDAW